MAEKFDMEKWRDKTLTREEFQKLTAIDMAAFLESGGGGRILQSGVPTMTNAEFALSSANDQETFTNRGGKLVN